MYIDSLSANVWDTFVCQSLMKLIVHFLLLVWCGCWCPVIHNESLGVCMCVDWSWYCVLEVGDGHGAWRLHPVTHSRGALASEDDQCCIL